MGALIGNFVVVDAAVSLCSRGIVTDNNDWHDDASLPRQ